MVDKVNNKPLSLDDPRFDAAKKTVLPVFRINGRMRVFTWNNAPRNKIPYGIISIAGYKNKTISEIAMAMNSVLAKGGELKVKVGTKLPEKKEKIVIDTSPKPLRYEEVEDWEKPSRAAQPLSKTELTELLGTEQVNEEVSLKEMLGE